jgi:hypothetical protein
MGAWPVELVDMMEHNATNKYPWEHPERSDLDSLDPLNTCDDKHDLGTGQQILEKITFFLLSSYDNYHFGHFLPYFHYTQLDYRGRTSFPQRGAADAEELVLSSEQFCASTV